MDKCYAREIGLQQLLLTTWGGKQYIFNSTFQQGLVQAID